MSTIVTRSGKGAALTHTEVDANFTNLNTDKAETSTVILATQKGAVSGVCPLDATSKVSSTYLPSYVDDVLEYANLAGFPGTGETGKIYVALDTNKTYRWSGSAYIYITSGAVDSVAGKTGVVTLTSSDVGLGSVSNTAQVTSVSGTAPIVSSGGLTPAISISASTTLVAGSMSAADKTKLDAITGTNTGNETSATIKTALGITTLSGSNTGDQVIPTTLPASDVYAWAKAATKPTYTATEVGLGSVNNTTDVGKPVSTATQTALDLKASLASPTLSNPTYTGTLTGGTGVVAIGTNQIYKDASGNVGIGTSSPSSKLDIGSTANAGTLSPLTFSGLNSSSTKTNYVQFVPSIEFNVAGSEAGGFILKTLQNGAYKNSIVAAAALVNNTNYLAFSTTNEAMRIDSLGNVTLQKNISVGAAAPTTSGTGITFPAAQSASSNANTLDDYEEGTWTPVVTGGTLVGTSSNTGNYTKIGQTYSFIIVINSTVSWALPANCTISLPFAVTGSGAGYALSPNTGLGGGYYSDSTAITVKQSIGASATILFSFVSR
jgi:hypothetical protein